MRKFRGIYAGIRRISLFQPRDCARRLARSRNAAANAVRDISELLFEGAGEVCGIYETARDGDFIHLEV